MAILISASSAAPGDGIGVPVYRVGYYYTPSSVSISTGAFAQGQTRATPLFCRVGQAFDRMAVEVTSAGEAGSVVRLGIYGSSGGIPSGTPLLDAGTVAGDGATGVKEVTISFVATEPVLWLTAVNQLCPATPATLRSYNGMTPGVGFSSTPSAGQVVTCYQASLQTGALGAFGTPSTQNAAPRVWLRAA